MNKVASSDGTAIAFDRSGEGSPAKFEGTFSRNTNTGSWTWPGGRYESTMTRVE
jgi:hypothetical protein